MTQPCTCASCIQKINSVPQTPFDKEFIERLKSGQVVHIETRDGRPRYRQQWWIRLYHTLTSMHVPGLWTIGGLESKGSRPISYGGPLWVSQKDGSIIRRHTCGKVTPASLPCTVMQWSTSGFPEATVISWQNYLTVVSLHLLGGGDGNLCTCPIRLH